MPDVRPHRSPSEPPRYRIVMREEAYADADAIGAYIARSHPLNAERYVQGIFDALEDLSLLPNAHPESAAFPGLNIRWLIIGSHRVFHRVNDAARSVEVLRIVHVRQRMENFYDELKDALQHDTE